MKDDHFSKTPAGRAIVAGYSNGRERHKSAKGKVK
jgi:hypothetical protein